MEKLVPNNAGKARIKPPGLWTRGKSPLPERNAGGMMGAVKSNGPPLVRLSRHQIGELVTRSSGEAAVSWQKRASRSGTCGHPPTKKLTAKHAKNAKGLQLVSEPFQCF